MRSERDPADSCRFFDDDDGNDYEVGFAIGPGAEYALTNHLSLGTAASTICTRSVSD
jgi:opacity protein-like surface antigen